MLLFSDEKRDTEKEGELGDIKYFFCQIFIFLQILTNDEEPLFGPLSRRVILLNMVI